MRSDSAQQESDVRPVIPNFDHIFREPILAPDPLEQSGLGRGFIARHRNAIWCAIVLMAIGLSAAALMGDSEVIAEPGCGSGLFY
jgi:hypothetical protein